ncbi:CatB-related O-acetyltransferase [Methylobacterium gregans]|uniref:2,3,4,5-tetrahydropyridine-2,6-dicarboxylate N-acetyltransferase n=1 Tax=Methylobacterium gregans TaxID=374424 RepID=A0AA37HM12_9HYPH|nr:CatB-related O-acetyltransferase [Methylobacterium gregans]MDQ0521926.1 acetyltransferase-like isoleucine patch superfamily enzyme [Methylobacterium gregans]GJD78040.1 2,3,4,5-tetrahydropyridine-2,6-dicarboxylate N-acetyltransferase [Methylobacterium gregans]
MAMFFTNDSMRATLASYGLRTPPGVLIDGSFHFEDPCRLAANCILQHASIAAYSYIMHNVQLEHTEVGRYCSIARNVTCLGSTHPTTSLSTSPVFYDKTSFNWRFGDIPVFEPEATRKIRIGHDVWIGANAVVSPGVTIGQGAVIGANAVVTNDVDPYMIVAGVPARVVRSRFSDRLIQRILASNWTDYDIPAWLKSNSMPDTRNLSEKTFASVENAINSGVAPPIRPQAYRLFRRQQGDIAIEKI